jgi:hypothetical protein
LCPNYKKGHVRIPSRDRVPPMATRRSHASYRRTYAGSPRIGRRSHRSPVGIARDCRFLTSDVCHQSQ